MSDYNGLCRGFRGRGRRIKLKRKISLERIGMRGSIILIIIASILLSIGIIVQVNNAKLPEKAVVCTATITGFNEVEASDIKSTTTLVEYTYNNQKYENITLRQYEGSWKIGDNIKVYVSQEEPTVIWTNAMKYHGAMIIFLSVPFWTIGIYKIVQFKRYKKIEDDERDTDTEEEIKYKRSSFIIPLAAGIPFTVFGLFLRAMENNSVLALVIIIMGGSAVIVGIISLMNFINLKLKK